MLLPQDGDAAMQIVRSAMLEGLNVYCVRDAVRLRFRV